MKIPVTYTTNKFTVKPVVFMSANHKQEPWKAPLPEFIEDIYFKRFKKDKPDVVKKLK